MVYELARCAHCGGGVVGTGFWSEAPVSSDDTAVHLIEKQFFCNDVCHRAFTTVVLPDSFWSRCRECRQPSQRVFMGGATADDLMQAPMGTNFVRSTRYQCGHEIREVLCCRTDPEDSGVIVVDCVHRVVVKH